MPWCGSSTAVSSVLEQSDPVIVRASSAGAAPKGAAQAKMVQELQKNVLAAASEAGVTVEELEVPNLNPNPNSNPNPNHTHSPDPNLDPDPDPDPDL